MGKIHPSGGKFVEILLVEDNPGDVELTREAFAESHIINNLHVVKDGVEAMDFLLKKGAYASAPRPDLVLLDLNLPKKNGHEVLIEIKENPGLKMIPVVVLTTSDNDEDIVRSYSHYANCYVSKPLDFEQFLKVVQAVEGYWFSIVKLPDA